MLGHCRGLRGYRETYLHLLLILFTSFRNRLVILALFVDGLAGDLHATLNIYPMAKTESRREPAVIIPASFTRPRPFVPILYQFQRWSQVPDVLLDFGRLSVFLINDSDLGCGTGARWIASCFDYFTQRRVWLVQLLAALQQRLLDELLHVWRQLDKMYVAGRAITALSLRCLLGHINIERYVCLLSL